MQCRFLTETNMYFAEVWLNRNQYCAYGNTEHEAKVKLLDHLQNIILVHEEQLKVQQQTLQDIKDYLNKGEI
jgi:hypothetical protein